MIQRLYCLLPNKSECETVVDELLLHRIDINQMHVVANDETNLGDLPEASLMQKKDFRRSFIKGLLAGSAIGILAGFSIHLYLAMAIGPLMMVTTIVGAIFGAWSASMIGLMVPNQELNPYMKKIQSGQLLLIVDVPKAKLGDVETLLKKHRDAQLAGTEATIPPFP